MKAFYRWTRDLHLWLGLFLSPFLVVYAVSTILINHNATPGRDAPEETSGPVLVVVPDEEDRIRLGRDIIAQLGITGELGGVRRMPAQQKIVIPVNVPGKRQVVTVDTTTSLATVATKSPGFLSGLVYLHFAPGQHLVGISGNWFWMRLWHWMADATVYVVLFLTASGVYLWTVLKAERKVGLICLGAGAVSFVVLVCGLLF